MHRPSRGRLKVLLILPVRGGATSPRGRLDVSFSMAVTKVETDRVGSTLGPDAPAPEVTV